MTQNTPTALWNDSADPNEIKQGLEWGVVGATCNPVIALACIKADQPRWNARIRDRRGEPDRVAVRDRLEDRRGALDRRGQVVGAGFQVASGGINGRLSLQTDPSNYRNAKALADQAVHFSTLAPNVIVKIPATKTGIEAIEDAVYRGVSMNVTVSFTVPQAVEAAEAIERG